MAKRDKVDLQSAAQDAVGAPSLLNRTAERQAGPRPSLPSPGSNDGDGAEDHVTSNVVTQERETETPPPGDPEQQQGPARSRPRRAEAGSRVGGAVEGLRFSAPTAEMVAWRREIPKSVLDHSHELSTGGFVGSTLKIPERASLWMEEYLHQKNRGRPAKERISKQALLALAIQRFIADIEAEEGIIEVPTPS